MIALFELFWVLFLFPAVIFFLMIIMLVPVGKRKQEFEDVYKTQDAFVEQYKSIENHPLKKIEYLGVDWEYYVNGKGETTLFFIHGMAGIYKIWWRQLVFFEKTFRVLSYTLPTEVDSTKKAVEGIIKILNKESIDKAIFIGTSMGGYILQRLMQLYPEKVEKVILSNTYPPNHLQKKKNEITYTAIKLLPDWIIRKYLIRNYKKEIFPAGDNSPLLKATLLNQPITRLKLINRFKIVIDFFTLQVEKIDKSIPKLIIESDNDPLVEPELRTLLKDYYPEAKVYTFKNAGHFPYVNRGDEYNKVLNEFIHEG